MKAHHCLTADVIPFSWVDGPGNRFVLFMQGCNFNCIACHNPQTIPLQTPKAKALSIDEVITRIKNSMPYISGITVSGGEATIQFEFIEELFKTIKSTPELSHLTTFIDSNGNTPRPIWELLAPATDGVMLDLKVLDPIKHEALTGYSHEAVLGSIKFLASRALLYEVRLLLIPGINDSDQELRDTAAWLLSIDPLMRIKINAFNSHGVRASARGWRNACEDDCVRYRNVLTQSGVVNLA